MTTTDPAAAPATTYSYTVTATSADDRRHGAIAGHGDGRHAGVGHHDRHRPGHAHRGQPGLQRRLRSSHGGHVRPTRRAAAITYGGNIPALPAGTTVRYYICATDNAGLTTTDPGPPCSRSATCTPTRCHAEPNIPTVLSIPGGTFTMGDEFNTVDPNHPSDEVPLHTVTVSGFDMGDSTSPPSSTAIISIRPCRRG